MSINIAIGARHKNWTLLRDEAEIGTYKYLCQCICGTKRLVSKYNLGKVKGCGCEREESCKYGKGGTHYRPKTAKKKSSKNIAKPFVVKAPVEEKPLSKSIKEIAKPLPLEQDTRRLVEIKREELALKRELESL